MKYISTALLVFVLVFISFFVIYNYIPLGAFEVLSIREPVGEPIVGVALTTILGTDTLSASRTTINNNFIALNDGKIENTSTSVAAITTLQNLSTVGTITTGIWSGTAIAVNRGGTGTTSPTTNMVMIGSGASGLKVVDGFGVAGQFLTSNGDGSAPTWQTSAVDQGINYNWTGSHNFTAAVYFKTFHASSTLTLNGVQLKFPPAAPSASSTLLASDSSGNLSWVSTSSIISFDSIVDTATKNNSGTGSTTFLYKIPAGWFGPNNVLHIKIIGTGTGSNSDKSFDVLLGNGSATSSLSYIEGRRLGNDLHQLRIDLMIVANGATDSQTSGSLITSSYDGTTHYRDLVNTSYDTTGNLYLAFVLKAPTDTARFRGINIIKY